MFMEQTVMYQALEIARTTHVTYIMEPAWNAILDGLDHFAQIVRSKQYSNYDHMMIKRFFLKLANHSAKYTWMIIFYVISVLKNVLMGSTDKTA